MQGFELAYTQSDEATFMLWDFRELDTQPWFGYEVNKLVSITAATFTAHFHQYWYGFLEKGYNTTKLPVFDARAFNVPYDDWPNVFIWRQRDWERNSVQMLARSLYSQKKLHGKPVSELKELCSLLDKDWDKQSDHLKYGTFIDARYSHLSTRLSYDDYKLIEAHTEKNRDRTSR